MKRNKIVITVIALLFSYLQVNAQSDANDKNLSVVLSIEQAVDLGLSQNKTIKTIELSTLKSQYVTKEIQANRYPQINAITSYVRNLKPTVFFFPKIGVSNTGELSIDDSEMMTVNASSKNHFNAIIDLQLPLFNPELEEGIKLSKLNTELTKVNREVAKWELADEIRKAYYNTLLAELNKALIEKAIARAEQTLTDTRVLYQNGVVLVSDTLNVYINVQSQKSNLYIVNNQITQSMNYLKDLIGISLDNQLILIDNIDEDFLSTQILGQQASTSFLERPDIKQNISHQSLAKKQIDLDKSRRLPTLSFVSQYQIQAQSDKFKFQQYDWPQSFFIGMQLNIPIFNGFKHDRKAQQSFVTLQELKITEEQLTSKALLEYKNAEGDFIESFSKIKINKDIVQAAERSLELVNERYKKGIGRYQDVLDGQFSVIQSNNAYNKAIYDAYIALATKKKALGIIK